MPTEAYQSELDAINTNIANQQVAFAKFMDQVVAVLRSRGYTVRMRLDTGGDGVFSTNATAQVDVTKDGVTARAAYTNFHTSQSPTTAARVAETAWLTQKNSTALGFAPTVEGDPLIRDPIKTQTAFNLNVEVPFATTKLGAPAVSLPPTNQPGKTNTTATPGSDPAASGTSGMSPSNPTFGDAPPAPTNQLTGPVMESGPLPAPTDNRMMIVAVIAAIVIAFLIFRG